jgi:hypothetical protein
MRKRKIGFGLSAAVIAFFLTACGNHLQSACYGQCDAQAKATGCSSMVFSDSDCHKACDSYISALHTNCQSAAMAAWSCGESASWSCAGSNLPTASGCDSQNLTLAQCQ